MQTRQFLWAAVAGLWIVAVALLLQHLYKNPIQHPTDVIVRVTPGAKKEFDDLCESARSQQQDGNLCGVSFIGKNPCAVTITADSSYTVSVASQQRDRYATTKVRRGNGEQERVAAAGDVCIKRLAKK